MAVERPFEPWEEVQRHGQDLADRLAQGFTGLIQSHMKPFDFEFPSKSFAKKEFNFVSSSSGVNGVSTIFDIGNRIGQAGADFGASLNGVVQQVFRRLPVPFWHDEVHVNIGAAARSVGRQVADADVAGKEDLRTFPVRLNGIRCGENEAETDGWLDEEVSGLNLRTGGHFSRPQGTVSVTSTYSSRTNEVESSLVARGDLWRVEASHGGSTSSNDNSLFLLQLGPVLFVRDSTLLLPVHLSKQHLLWYGYDRKHGMHSLCPAVWSKNRRWLLMSMLCLNPPACSFVDLQFPNGQVTYISGEGISTSAFVPFCGGLLQAQGHYPGEMRYSFSYKNKWGTRITPAVQWPDKSFAMGVAQDLVWKKSGLLVKPTVQVSVCPTFGGSNPGVRAELIHSVKEDLNLICGYALAAHPSVFGSISIGRSKWNGNVGNSGIVLRVDAPLSGIGRPSFSVQINSGLEF